MILYLERLNYFPSAPTLTQTDRQTLKKLQINNAAIKHHQTNKPPSPVLTKICKEAAGAAEEAAEEN